MLNQTAQQNKVAILRFSKTTNDKNSRQREGSNIALRRASDFSVYIYTNETISNFSDDDDDYDDLDDGTSPSDMEVNIHFNDYDILELQLLKLSFSSLLL